MWCHKKCIQYIAKTIDNTTHIFSCAGTYVLRARVPSSHRHTHLQGAIVQVHDNRLARAKPLLHEDTGGHRRRCCPLLLLLLLVTLTAAQKVTAVYQMLAHVLREVQQQRRLLLMLAGRRRRRERVDAIAQIVVLDDSEAKDTQLAAEYCCKTEVLLTCIYIMYMYMYVRIFCRTKTHLEYM